MKRACLLMALLALPGAALAGTVECGVEYVHRDVRQTLWGGIEASGLRIGWTTWSESNDLEGYEVWRRRGDRAERVAVVTPKGRCSSRTTYEIVVPYDAGYAYHVEVHDRYGEHYASPVPGTSE